MARSRTRLRRLLGWGIAMEVPSSLPRRRAACSQSVSNPTRSLHRRSKSARAGGSPHSPCPRPPEGLLGGSHANACKAAALHAAPGKPYHPAIPTPKPGVANAARRLFPFTACPDRDLAPARFSLSTPALSNRAIYRVGYLCPRLHRLHHSSQTL
jgi:hypothetical protein